MTDCRMDREISQQQSVEYLANQQGRLSLFYRTAILEKRTADLSRVSDNGKRISQMPLLVDDDLDANIKMFREQKEELEGKLRDIRGRLCSQLVPGKIETGDVKRWQRKVEEITCPTATQIENEFNTIPCPVSLLKLVEETNGEMEKLLSKGARLLESLIVDDYSQILGDDEMQSFDEWKEKLQHKQRNVQEKLSTELQDLEKIETEPVKLWLKKVEEIISAASIVHEQLRSGHIPYHACLVARVKDKGDQLPESLVVDDSSIPKLALLTLELQGSDAVKAEIWGHLMGDETTKIGVWGMGGIGKTTIVKHVYNQLLKESKFKKVILITVSQTFDVHRIQQEIASSLQEDKILPNYQGGHLLAAALSKMLEKYKHYVLILDDIWERFELHEVGIPEICGSKLVLTTRSEQVARIMDCKRVKVNTLSWDASLKLFKDIAVVEAFSGDGGTEETLEKVARECAGLPLAIKTVAASMKGESDPRLWCAALKQLKQGRRNVAGTENDQFRILKFSYDQLSDKKIQHCFLHCAMYPEDHHIPIEKLYEYGINEDVIGIMGTRQDMNAEDHAILSKLKENCLLEFIKIQFGSNCVRMHDLVRDMAIDITRSSSPCFLVKDGVGLRELPEEHEWKDNLLKVSLMSNYIEDISLSMPSPRCPTLTTLPLSGYYNKLSTIPENLFEHMPELKVLDLSYNEELRNLPSSVSKLVKLTTLLLRSCKSLKKVPSLSNLIVLKMLDLYGA